MLPETEEAKGWRLNLTSEAVQPLFGPSYHPLKQIHLLDITCPCQHKKG